MNQHNKQQVRRKISQPTGQKKVPSPFLAGTCDEMEREKLARSVHDLIGQPLTAVKLMLGRMANYPRENSHLLGEAGILISEMQVKVRELILSLQPSSNDIDLRSCLISLVAEHNQRAQKQADLRISGLAASVAVPVGVTRVLLHFIQEALTHINLHHDANEATIKVWNTDRYINVQVQYSGTCFWLNSVCEILSLAQGKLNIESVPGAGTKITARFPLAGN